jgi:hypothetical protein
MKNAPSPAAIDAAFAELREQASALSDRAVQLAAQLAEARAALAASQAEVARHIQAKEAGQ